MEEKKKKNLKNILLYCGLGFLIAFTIITSIVINFKQNQYEDLKDKNQEMDNVIDEEAQLNLGCFQNFSKNLYNFIDK